METPYRKVWYSLSRYSSTLPQLEMTNKITLLNLSCTITTFKEMLSLLVFAHTLMDLETVNKSYRFQNEEATLFMMMLSFMIFPLIVGLYIIYFFKLCLPCHNFCIIISSYDHISESNRIKSNQMKPNKTYLFKYSVTSLPHTSRQQ